MQQTTMSLLGIEFSAIYLEQALELVQDKLTSSKSSNFYFINAHCFNVSCANPIYREALHQADLIFPDGAGVELGCKLKQDTLPANLNGTDLFPHLCQLFEMQNKRVFLLGAEPGTAQKVAQWMTKEYPSLTVCGSHHGHFSEQEQSEVIEKINDANPDVLFVAMGVPRQELWLHQYKSQLKSKLNIAVGGLFEFYSQNIPRAPLAIRRLKIEWLWRMIQEPKRMWRRYLIGNLIYLRHAYLEGKTHRMRTLFSQSRFLNIFQAQLSSNISRIHFQCTRKVRNFSNRCFDLMLSGGALLTLLPCLPFIALAIKLDSKGPVFFKQRRVGANGQPFQMYKLRSMSNDAETKLAELKALNEKQGGVMFKMKDDPRVTKVGKFLRKYSIDELPQLWNVFIGDMSVVGPRPALYNEVEQYQLNQRYRLDAKPGLTSEWVLVGRNALTFEQQARLDIDYVYQHSLLADLKILLKTIPIVVTGKGAS